MRPRVSVYTTDVTTPPWCECEHLMLLRAGYFTHAKGKSWATYQCPNCGLQKSLWEKESL